MAQLAKLIRAKYPGAYDDLDDETLEKSVLEKHPEYKDLAEPEKPERSADDLIAEAKYILKEPKSTQQPEVKQEVQQPEEQSILSKVWHKVSDPLTDAPSRFARSVSDRITQPNLETSPTGEGGIKDFLLTNAAKLRGFGAGAIEGAGDVASGLTSPINLATMTLTGGAAKLPPGIGRLAGIGARMASAPVAAHGAINLLHPKSSMSERGFGLAEMAGGITGLRSHLPQVAESTARGFTPEEDTALKSLFVGEKPTRKPATIQEVMVGETPVAKKGSRFTPNKYGGTADENTRLEAPTSAGIPRFGSSNLTKEEINDLLQQSPQSARTKSGIKIGADVESLGKVLGSSLYQGDISTIATKELLQNSMDAIRHLGKSGEVKVNFSSYDEPTKYLEVSDNGKGLTRREIETVFTDLGSSGKRSDKNAIGGFGLAKAAPLLGGEGVEVTSVARDKGGLIRTSFSGTPDELLKGVDIKQERVADGTPTGTNVRVYVPNDSSFYDSEKFVNNIAKYSNFEGNIHLSDKYARIGEFTPIAKGAGGELIKQLDNESASTKLIIPHGTMRGERSSTRLILSNNGMFQGSQMEYLPTKIPNMPEEIVVDINSKVPEGHHDYPFTANRENLRGSVLKTVNEYIENEIVKPAIGKATDELKALYGKMTPVKLESGRTMHVYDTGSKHTPDEIQTITSSPHIRGLADQIGSITDETLKLVSNPEWIDRLERTGIILDESLRGIHIPNPGTKKSAILINPLQIMTGRGPDEAAAGFVHTILHEIAHIDPIAPAGHNESFTVRLGDIYEKYGARRAVAAQDQFLKTIAPNGEYIPEIQEILRQYHEARGRTATEKDALTGTGIGQSTGTKGQTGIPSSSRQNKSRASELNKPSMFTEAMNFPRTVMASMDMSAPLRQGIGLIHKKQFWTSLGDMVKAFGSEKAFQEIQQSILDKPIIKSGFAERVGLKLTDLTDVTKREESMMSQFAEKLPGVRRSNRAYTTFLNKLRADTFESLIESGKAYGANGEINMPIARGLADFVNTATGRGSLGNLESSAVALNNTFFSPRLIASRLKMLNPVYYATAHPTVRQEALKSLLAVAGSGMAIGQLAKMAGAKVETDPVSSDFGKIKIGNTRIDPFGGFQQYVVAASRLISGRTKSSVTGNEYELGKKFGGQNRLDALERFGESKLNPVLSFAAGMLRGKDFAGKPFDVPEEVVQRFIPMFLQDLKQVATDNPKLIPGWSKGAYDKFFPEKIPLAAPAWFGMGVQNYESRPY